MMDLDDDDVLRTLAAGGSMDYSVWPALLQTIVSRIEKIAHEEFPIPNLPPRAPVVIPSSIPRPPASDSDTENFLPPLPSSPTNPPSTTSSQDTNKENTPIAPRSLPQVTSAPAPNVPAPEPLPPGTLPAQIQDLLTEITRTLTETFPTYPPHTIQRLAELVLTPKRHYKSLPTYLHAMDRVVHVTSGLNVYPLPPAIPDMSTSSGLLSNGVPDAAGPNPFATPGSDEALGGALLTPIPWLQPHGPETNALSPPNSASSHGDSSTGSDRASGGGGAQDSTPNESPELRTESTETIDGPNGMGSIETVTVTVNGLPNMGTRGVGVTQGELLRQEQRAGVVPVSQLASHLTSHHHAAAAAAQHRPSSAATPSSTAAAEDAVESGDVVGTVQGADEDEKPHARGPDEIGAEDMGPQPENASNTNYHTGGPNGSLEMQGIDVEAAVGRKATESHSSPEPKSSADPASKDEADAGDKMEGIESSRARSATPKREAEDDLEGERKKLKEDSSAAPADEKVDKDDDKTAPKTEEDGDAQSDGAAAAEDFKKESPPKD
ncbi:hypothetical protein LQW54_008364 [Pestalotiopsis sp. IQ-011]